MQNEINTEKIDDVQAKQFNFLNSQLGARFLGS